MFNLSALLGRNGAEMLVIALSEAEEVFPAMEMAG